MGKNKIGKFLSNATKDLPLSRSGKYSNHPVRKTCIKTLLDSGVSHNSVAQLSGHKSLKRLDSYAVASHQQQRQMSKILSGKENSEPKPNPNQSSGRTVQDCTVQIHFTGFPNEWRDIIGPLKMRAKQNKCWPKERKKKGRNERKSAVVI